MSKLTWTDFSKIVNFSDCHTRGHKCEGGQIEWVVLRLQEMGFDNETYGD